MHELPEDLTNKLRSFRGSIYGRDSNRAAPDHTIQDVDAAKDVEAYGDTEFDRALSDAESSIVLVRYYIMTIGSNRS